MKKLFIITISALFLPSIFTHAATFNTAPGDYRLLEVGNATLNSGSVVDWSNSVSAKAGETLSFKIYYSNTSGQTANHTKTRLILPTSTFKSINILAEVWANELTVTSGHVSIFLDSNQTLSYVPNSTRWYPNRNLNNQPTLPLPLGQNGSEVITFNGFNVGTVNSGPNYGIENSGFVVFRVLVSNNPVTPTGQAPSVTTSDASLISTRSATMNANINPNNAPTSAWFEYGTTLNLGQTTAVDSIGSGGTNFSFSRSLTGLAPNTRYYFRAVAENSHGRTPGLIFNFLTLQDTGTTPTGQIPSVITSTASSITNNSTIVSASINPNNAATTAWFEYGTTVSLGQSTIPESIGSGGTSITFSKSLTGLTSNTTYYYRAVAENSHGRTPGGILSFVTLRDTDIIPIAGQAPFVTTSAASSIATRSAVVVGNITPNNAPTNVWFEYGTDSFTLNQNTSSEAIGNSGTNLIVSKFLNNLAPNTTYYYRAVAQNSYGKIPGGILSFVTLPEINPNQQIYPQPIYPQQIYPSHNYVVQQQLYPRILGQAPFINTSDAYSISSRAATLSAIVNPNNTPSTVWFEYGTSLALGQNTGSELLQNANESIIFTRYINNLIPNTRYYYRVVASSQYGTTYGLVYNFTTLYEDVVEYRPQYQNYPATPRGQIPVANTLDASAVSGQGAVLNSNINPGSISTTAWFEYGTSLGLGQSTNHEPIGNSQDTITFSKFVSNLRPNTRYYYRIVANNSYGTSQGIIYNFTTSMSNGDTGSDPIEPRYQDTPPISKPPVVLKPKTPKPVIKKPTTPIVYAKPKIQSPIPVNVDQVQTEIIVTPPVVKPTFKPGDKFTYTFTYKTGVDPISDAILRMQLPKEIIYLSSNIPSSGIQNDLISFYINSIKPNKQGSVTIWLQIKEDTKPNITLTIDSSFDYIDKTGSPQFLNHQSKIYITATTMTPATKTEKTKPKTTEENTNTKSYIAYGVLGLITLIIIGFIIYTLKQQRLRNSQNLETL